MRNHPSPNTPVSGEKKSVGVISGKQGVVKLAVLLVLVILLEPTSSTGYSDVLAVSQSGVDDKRQVIFELLQQRSVIGVLSVVQGVVKVLIRHVAECVTECRVEYWLVLDRNSIGKQHCSVKLTYHTRE